MSAAEVGGVPRVEAPSRLPRSRLRLPQSVAGRVALAVALVAYGNALAWALITPPFQVPDETAHFAYVQHLAETGHRAGEVGHPEFSAEQAAAMDAMSTVAIIGRPLVHPPASGTPDRAADAALAYAERHAARDDGGGPSTASSQPPLYYLIAAIPYRLFAWASLPARLEAIRVLSALLFALSAALVALLVFELLPRVSWAPAAGGLAVALSPYTAFIASGVTPDVMLLLTGTLTLLLVARAFRRGLTIRRAALLGLVVSLGALSKLTFLAFVPPAALAFLVLLWRDRAALAAERPRGALRATAAGVSAVLALPLVFLLWTKVSGMPLQPAGSVAPSLPSARIPPASSRELLSYAWQLYLPRLPFMTNLFGFWPPDQTWLQGFAGRYGWLDTSAPGWIIDLARHVVGIGLVLIAVAAVRWRREVWRQRLLAVVLALFAVALMAVIAKTGYDYKRGTGFIFEQARYLFPLAGLYAVAVAVACLGAGRHLGPLVASFAVGLFCLHDVSGLLVVLARYYG